MPHAPKHTYAVRATDISCDCLPTVSSFVRVLLGNREGPDAARHLRDFLAFHDACLSLGSNGTGEFRPGAEARVVVMPDVGGPRLALVWREGADGLTYVASEVPMPWLAEAPIFEMRITVVPSPTTGPVAGDLP